MPPPTITIRAGHPDFLDLPWAESLDTWQVPELVDLPKGISRHVVRFVQTEAGLYAVKELPEKAARNDYEVLRSLEEVSAPAVVPVGLVTNRRPDRDEEASAALITAYASFAFSYRELIAGPGFGPNRTKMLDAFAHLLVELHIAGCFWGDCSLSNVLYRWDADTLETIMVDAETASLYPDGLTDGVREHDLSIMVDNVAGGMADIAAEAGSDLDEADLSMGEDIAERYRLLWRELRAEEVIGPQERYRITDRIRRINAIGFDVEEVDLVPAGESDELRFKLRVGGRTYHSRRLRDLTGIDALEGQARQILSDLHHAQAREGASSPTMKNVAAVKWRVGEFEPMVARLEATDGVNDPVQAYADLLHHRYLLATDQGRDVSTDEAYDHWVDAGRPGYPPPEERW